MSQLLGVPLSPALLVVTSKNLRERKTQTMSVHTIGQRLGPCDGGWTANDISDDVLVHVITKIGEDTVQASRRVVNRR